MPLLINIVLFLIGIPLAIWAGVAFVDRVFAGASWWLELLTVIIQVAIVALTALAGVLLFTLVGVIIAGPFSGPLSEAVERRELELRRLPLPIWRESGATSDIIRGILYQLGRLLLYPLIFATQFVPVVGPFLHPILAFLYATFVLAIDFSDPTLDRYLHSFREKVEYVTDRKALYLGFGTGALLLMLIPFVNLLVIPVCVVAGAQLVVEDLHGFQPRESRKR